MLAIAAGSLLVAHIEVAIAFGLIPVGALLLVSPHARLAVVTFGAVLAFQSSSGASALKTGYLLCFLISLAGASASIWKKAAAPTSLSERRIASAGVAFLTLAILSFVPALVYGTPLIDWSRDVFSYVLFGAAPIFAIDYARHVSTRTLTIVFLTCAGISTASFFVSWIARRNTSELGLTTLAFSSFLLSVALIAFAFTNTLWPGARRLIWGAIASTAFLALLATGTRSSLVAGVAVIVAVALAPTSLGNRLIGIAALVAILAGIGAVALQGGFVDSAVNVKATGDRLGTFASAIADPRADQSLELRRVQTTAAISLFRSAPIFGVGPGHPIKWIGTRGTSGADYFVDSPAGFVAKFGILGLVALLVFIWFVCRFLLATRARATASGLALISFLVTTGTWSVLGTPFDDKGTSLALSLLLALTLAETASSGAQPTGMDASPFCTTQH